MQKRGYSGHSKCGKTRLSEQAVKAVRQVECIHHADRVQHGNSVEGPAAKKNCSTRQMKDRNDQWVCQIEKEPGCCCLNQEFLVATQSVISVFDLFSPVVQKTGKKTDGYEDHCGDVQPCPTRSPHHEEISCHGSGNVENQHQTARRGRTCFGFVRNRPFLPYQLRKPYPAQPRNKEREKSQIHKDKNENQQHGRLRGHRRPSCDCRPSALQT